MRQNPPVNLYFVNGIIASGKDTMVKRMLREIPGSTLISTGDIYRGGRDNTGEYAKYHDAMLPFVDLVQKHGGLVDDEVMIPIVGEVLEQKISEGFTDFIFNGFPRTVPQLAATDDMIQDLRKRFLGERAVLPRFMGLAVTERMALVRVEQRRLAALRRGLPVRAEDEPEQARGRIIEYRREGKTRDMLHRLAEECRLIVIKGSGGKTDEWRRIKKALGLEREEGSHPGKESLR